MHTNYLFRQGVACRLDGYWPIIRPIFGTDDRIWIFVLRRIFFSFFVFLFLSSPVPFSLAPTHTYIARIPNISIRNIGIANIARKMKQGISLIGINEVVGILCEKERIFMLISNKSLRSFSFIYIYIWRQLRNNFKSDVKYLAVLENRGHSTLHGHEKKMRREKIKRQTPERVRIPSNDIHRQNGIIAVRLNSLRNLKRAARGKRQRALNGFLNYGKSSRGWRESLKAGLVICNQIN